MPKYKTTFIQMSGAPLPDFVHPILDRTGVFRTYFRRAGQELARGEGTIKGATLRAAGRVELSRSWWATYFHLRNGTPLPAEDGERDVERGQIIGGSWDALMRHFEAENAAWKRNKEGSTKRGHRIYFGVISKVLGPHRVAKTTTAHIAGLIHAKEFGDPAKGTKPAPGAARCLRTAFHILAEHAVDIGWIPANPVSRIEKPKPATRTGHHTWTEREIAAWRNAHPDYASDARCLIEMAAAWGARAGDLLDLGFKNIEDGVLTFTPRKTERSTGAIVHLAVRGDHLLACLAHRRPDQMFFFQQPPAGSNQFSRNIIDLHPRPRSYTWLNKSFVDWRRTAGLSDDCTPHGLRKLFATRMANAGASLTDIADALGDTEESAKIYVQARDHKQGARRAQAMVSEAA